MAKLSKQEVVNQFHAQLQGFGLDVSKKDAKDIFNAYGETVKGLVQGFASGEYDAFSLDFAVVKAEDVAERTGVSALNGKEWTSPAHKRASVKLSNGIKEELKASTQA